MKSNLAGISLTLLLMLSAVVHAGDVVGLKTFVSGTPALAADVNGNFNAVKSAVDDNQSRLTTLEGVDAAARIAALEAQLSATVACPANTPTRFTDLGDGTVCDSQTGLMWEQKTGTVGAIVQCLAPADCPNPHDVNNTYSWSEVSLDTEPSGTLYSNFLARLNDLVTANDGATTPCFAGHCDWRIPTISELRSILQTPYPDCTASPCIADGFSGPVQAADTWSSSTVPNYPSYAWFVRFDDGFVVGYNPIILKTSDMYARAVRGGR